MWTVERVKRGIYTWGFYPALFMLRKEQENENYQNCQVIKQALDEVSEGIEWHISSRVDDESMEQTYDNIMRSLGKPELVDANMPHYIDYFREFLGAE